MSTSHHGEDGELAFKVGTDPAAGTVILDFGKHVKWIGLKPDDVAALVKVLVRHARKVATKPFTVDL